MNGSLSGSSVNGILQPESWSGLPFLLQYAEYIMWNAGLDKAQAVIKIARRNINNLRYVDDTTLMAENEEELRSFLVKVKVDLKVNIQKTKIMASDPITSGK